MKIIDLRSDTVSIPTEEMRKVMYTAEIGDDVYQEDTTVNQLEELGAEISGKEAALFVPTGTMGNLLAIMSHTQRGEQVIADEWSHILKFEGGGVGSIAGLSSKEIQVDNGIFTAEIIKEEIVTNDDVHCAQTGLICLENTHNMAGGIVTPLKQMEEIYWLSRQHDIPLHIDGARIFNAATHLKCNLKELSALSDSMMFCLSKGLCSPVGSLLVGTTDFIKTARKHRKTLGGGMRQAGVFAAAGIISLNKMSKRLEEDHENLSLLAEKLQEFNSFNINMANVQTNILMVDLINTEKDADTLVEEMKNVGVLCSAITAKRIRFVTHYYIKKEDISLAIDRISSIIN